MTTMGTVSYPTCPTINCKLGKLRDLFSLEGDMNNHFAVLKRKLWGIFLVVFKTSLYRSKFLSTPLKTLEEISNYLVKITVILNKHAL